MWLSSSSSFSITSQKSLHRKEVRIRRCKTSLILVLSHGFNNKFFFELLFLFVMRISVLQFGAGSSFGVRTDQALSGVLCCCSAGWIAADGWVPFLTSHCAVSPAFPAENEKPRMFSVPPWSTAALLNEGIFQIFLSWIAIVSFPYLYSHVCQQTDCCVFSSEVIPAATGALLHNAVWHCSLCFYIQCLINMHINLLQLFR